MINKEMTQRGTNMLLTSADSPQISHPEFRQVEESQVDANAQTDGSLIVCCLADTGKNALLQRIVAWRQRTPTAFVIAYHDVSTFIAYAFT
jgi:hypothetical protein